MHVKMHYKTFDVHDVICTTINVLNMEKDMLVYHLFNDINNIKCTEKSLR